MLVVFPWTGEFGWEIYAWQSAMRFLSHKYDHVVVYCMDGHDVLYVDFANEIINVGPYDGNLCSYDRGSIQYAIDSIPGSADVTKPETFDYESSDKEFKRFGRRLDINFDVMFHVRATDKLGTTWKNWDMDSWNLLRDRFGDMKCACIGTKLDAGLLRDSTDLRGIDVSDLADYLSGCRLLVGPSSGPIHLGCFCGTTHVTWGQQRVRERHEKLWNPFGAKCHYLSELQPEIDTVWRLCEDAICLKRAT